MKPLALTLYLTAVSLAVPLIGQADEDFYGIIESRPVGETGTWVISGRRVEVAQRTKLDAEHGPLVVGACVEVEFEGARVDEIESEPAYKCRR